MTTTRGWRRLSTATRILIVVSAVLVVAAAIGVAVMSAGTGDEAVQYPPGQRPCVEAQGAAFAVDTARLGADSDPDGTITAALASAQDAFNDRAGESSFYDAAAYNAAADRAWNAAQGLIDAYAAEDPDTPFVDDATGMDAALVEWMEATTQLDEACST